MFWSVYIDDYAEKEIFVHQAAAESARGSCSPQSAAVDERYEDVWHAPGSAAKTVNREPAVKVLGTQDQGYLGRRDLPPGYVTELICLFLTILGRQWTPRKWLQVAGGR